MTPATDQRRLPREIGGRVFGADVAGYRAARIGYPDALYDAIRARCGGPPRSALEIGPGTGLATADILAQLAPGKLTAVEPDTALARHLVATIDDARLKVVARGFVEAPLSGNFDLACSAAAFHWLDPDRALARLRILLAPGATLALWWNVYRQVGVGDSFADIVTPLLENIDLPPSEGASGHYSLDIDHHRNAVTAAGFTRFEPHLFRRERTLDTAQVRALYASYSYVRTLPAGRAVRLLDAIADLAETRFRGAVPNVVLTPLYLANAPSAL
jgi:SAM-dependent methyltransferase